MPRLAISKPPRFGGYRTGEGPFLVAEQLAFDEIFRYGRAVYLDEWMFPPGTRQVNRPGDDFLADPGLARYEYGGIGGGNFLDRLENLLDGRRAADETRQELTFVLEIFGKEFFVLL